MILLTNRKTEWTHFVSERFNTTFDSDNYYDSKTGLVSSAHAFEEG